jgi:hypothetical protein
VTRCSSPADRFRSDYSLFDLFSVAVLARGNRGVDLRLRGLKVKRGTTRVNHVLLGRISSTSHTGACY